MPITDRKKSCIKCLELHFKDKLCSGFVTRKDARGTRFIKLSRGDVIKVDG